MFDDSAIRPDDECLPFCDFHSEHARLYTICSCCNTVDIGKQRKRQSVILYERFVRFDVIETYAKNLRAQIAKREDIVAKLAGLSRAAWCSVLGVEIQNHPLIAVIFKRVKLAILIFKFELWRHCADSDVITGQAKRYK